MASIASIRESSPSSESGAMSPIQLTPNSKVKAMLAAFDNDSDDESVLGSARAKRIVPWAKTSTSEPKDNSETTVAQHTEKVTAHDTMNSPSEDDDVDIIRPKGRMAARMQANEDNSDEELPSAQTARERVKKLLMTKSKSPDAGTSTGDVSDASDTPVVSRKRRIRVARQDTPKSSPPRRSTSPGLFVSPAKSYGAFDAGSGSDVELPDAGNSRFLALVEKKKLERQAKEAEAAKEKTKRAEETQRYTKTLAEEDDIEDSEGERRLTQSSRPNRKASKKALEEMHRETQRLSRNQQLAHYATTKKKFTKADFFAKFNKQQSIMEATPEPARPASSSSAAPHSDPETKETPPTSPASPNPAADRVATPSNLPALSDTIDDDNAELPSLEDALSQMKSPPPSKMGKGKGTATDEPNAEAEIGKKPMSKKRLIRVRVSKSVDRKASPLNESDSDLEIVSAKSLGRKEKMDSVFDRVPAKLARESHSLHALRMLAQVTSPGKQSSKRIYGQKNKLLMSTSEMQMSLQQRARQQAAREREERLQALRDRGVVIQTTEERERDAVEVDDMVAQARLEGEEIAKREKAAAKKERKANGEADPLGDDSSDDEDWQETKEVPDEEEISGSGSEEEEGDEQELDGSVEDEDEMELNGQEPDTNVTNDMFDNEAAESDVDENEADANLSIDEEMAEDGDAEDAGDDEDEEHSFNKKTRRSRHANVISDDEDEDVEPVTQQTPVAPQFISPMHLGAKSPMVPTAVLRSATKTFIPGLTVAGPAGLGLTQIFAGTMDDSQAFEESPTAPNPESAEDPNKDSFAFLRRLRAPELPPFVPTLQEDTQDADMVNQSQVSHIPESQPMDSESQDIQFHFSQSQVHEFDSLVHDTQMSQMFEATQDVGYQYMTPVKGRFAEAPPSTVDTVILEPTALPETIDETPIAKKKGKLRQRAQIATFSDEEDAGGQDNAVEDDDDDLTANAFDVMRKSSKKKKEKKVEEDFDKQKSKAKEMVNEQADESEDEYAGLGGASDDESGGEDDAFVKEMINDEGGENFDAGKLAAIFADRERASDEKQIEKLYKDITNGMLRRKRGADYDLSDSDDGGEAKQRRKRKEFAKMRKALLADERIGKIAENPKKQAFLRAIEDRGSEDEVDFLEDFAEQENEDESQSQSQAEGQAQVVPDSESTLMGPPKRKASDDPEENQIRAPPHLRRTKPNKKPSNLSEIRESLSSLIEEPNALLAPEVSESESEDDLEIEGGEDLGPSKEKNKENRDPFALRRTSTAIVDRISLKRQSSSSISNSTKLAFAVSSSAPGFKVPALLRRATTNNSLVSSTSSSVSGGMSGTERMAGGASNEGVRRGGGKNSGVNYFARESERRANVVKTEKRREMKLVKGAQKRRSVVGGLFGGGKFE
ncbi:related to URK1 [Rhynchosporium graminicola]|uniref:Related to URK1 n=1 Tax=Rhynchosporium graminicola TaxID=2792576 RepID=A0A1E1JQ65_9HELO|nr:related to URK1 [Rhynchosporium commune]